MRAVCVLAHDGPAGVRTIDVPAPPEDGRVRIRVVAAGVAFPDLLHATGGYQTRHPLPRVLGSDFAGTVLSDPTGRFSTGQRVMGVAVSGAAAEVLAVDSGHLAAMPDEFTFEQAAAFPTNYLTAHYALVGRALLRAGEPVLVHGAAGGLGTALIQVARLQGASDVVAVVSTGEKAETAVAAGATEHVLTADLISGKAERPRPFAVVADPVGAQEALNASLRLMGGEGRYLILGFAAGSIPTLALNRLLLRNVAAIGVDWGGMAVTVPDLVRKQLSAMARTMARKPGVVRPVVGHVYEADDAVAALKLIEGRSARGKVVLRL